MTWLRITFRQLVRDLKAQKLRTFLTTLGIVWGTVSVSLLLAFGTGLHKQMLKNQAGLGRGIVIAWPSQTSLPFEGLGIMQYRPDSQEFGTVWINNGGTAIMSSAGHYDPNMDLFNTAGSYTEPMTGEQKSYRSEMRFQSEDRFTERIMVEDDDGKEFSLYEIVYTRR